MKRIAVFLFIVFSACATTTITIPSSPSPSSSPPPRAPIPPPAAAATVMPPPPHSVYADKLIKQLSLDIPKQELEVIFSDPRTIAQLTIVMPGKGDLYAPASIRRGLAFLNDNQAAFELARERFGVSPYVIASILRNETNFGSYTGRNLVVNTLYWLYVLSPDDERQKTILDRLSSFIRICEESGRDIFGIKGSSEGAFDMPQFMPAMYQELLKSKYRNLVDGDHDGKIDLSKPPDAILAVAWAFYMNGWGERAAREKRAIHLYNHDWTYVRMVMRYADALKQTACINGNMFSDPSCYAHTRHLVRHRRLHHKRKH